MSAPRAFLLAAAIVAAGEAAVAVALPVNQGRDLMDDVLADLERPRPARPAAVWCDSVTQSSLASAGPLDDVSDLSSVTSIGVPGIWFTYRRLVESSGPPGVLVLMLVPDSWATDLRGPLRVTYFETVFTRPGEIADYVRTTGRWGQGLTMAMNGLLRPPSVVRRATVRRAIRGLRGGGAPPTAAVPVLRVAGVDPAVVREEEARAAMAEFAFSDVSRLYLERIAEHTASTGTRLVLATGAIPRRVLEGWRRTGYLDGYRAMLEETAKRHPHVSVEPVDRFATWEVEEMYDRLHLKPAPSLEYGRRVKARLREIVDAAKR